MDFGTVATFGAAAAAGLDAAAFGSVRRGGYRLLVPAHCGLGAGMVPELNRGSGRRVEFSALLAPFGLAAAEGFGVAAAAAAVAAAAAFGLVSLAVNMLL